MSFYDPKAPKKAVNLSINADLLAKARGLGVNLSRVLEARLVELLRAAERERWVADNRAAIDDYNRRVGGHGLWSDGLRRF